MGKSKYYIWNASEDHIYVALLVKMDMHSRIELLHPSVLSSDITKNDIHKFSNSLSDQESTEIPIYT